MTKLPVICGWKMIHMVLTVPKVPRAGGAGTSLRLATLCRCWCVVYTVRGYLVVFFSAFLEEWVLQGERVQDLKFSKKHLSCWPYFILFHCKGTILQREMLIFLGQQWWNKSQLSIFMKLNWRDNLFFFKGIAVHKTSEWLKMPVHVTKNADFPFLIYHFGKVLCCKQNRS